jgi:hypothetical protein
VPHSHLTMFFFVTITLTADPPAATTVSAV